MLSPLYSPLSVSAKTQSPWLLLHSARTYVGSIPLKNTICVRYTWTDIPVLINSPASLYKDARGLPLWIEILSIINLARRYGMHLLSETSFARNDIPRNQRLAPLVLPLLLYGPRHHHPFTNGKVRLWPQREPIWRFCTELTMEVLLTNTQSCTIARRPWRNKAEPNWTVEETAKFVH